MIDIDELPDPDRELEAAARYAAQHMDEISRLHSWRMRVSKAVKAVGRPIGGLKLEFGSWNYPVTIADEMPQFGRNRYSFTLPMEVNGGRVYDVLTESLPELADEILNSWVITTEVDGKKCAEYLKTVGNEESFIAKRIKELRVANKEVRVA